MSVENRELSGLRTLPARPASAAACQALDARCAPCAAVLRPSVSWDWAVLARRFGQAPAGGCCIGVPCPSATEFARMLLEADSAAAPAHARHWTALARSGRIEGYAGLHRIDLRHAQCELRLYLPRGREQLAAGVEWAGVVLAFARYELEMRRVYALGLEHDMVAARVLATIGMHPEGAVRKRRHQWGCIDTMLCWSWTSSPAV